MGYTVEHTMVVNRDILHDMCYGMPDGTHHGIPRGVYYIPIVPWVTLRGMHDGAIYAFPLGAPWFAP